MVLEYVNLFWFSENFIESVNEVMTMFLIESGLTLVLRLVNRY